MSGRKQHYIPQVLLRSFSLHPEAKAPPIWVYSRLRSIYQTNTLDTATEREFYSPFNNDAAKTLDAEITRYENRFSELLAEVRISKIETAIKPDIAGEIIAHLTIRNAQTRSTLNSATQGILAGAGQLFSDTAWVQREMGFQKSLDQSPVKQMIRRVVAEKFPIATTEARSQMEVKLLSAIEGGFGSFYEGRKPEVESNIEQIGSMLLGSVADTQKKTLSKTLAPEKRIEQLSELAWTTEEGSFVLPDCCAVAISTDNVAPYVLSDASMSLAVYLPVSHSKVLIGRRHSDFLFQRETINRLSASCSADFFISHHKEDALTRLRAEIGKSIETALGEMVGSGITELKDRGIDRSCDGE